jgi:hypothetical protein
LFGWIFGKVLGVYQKTGQEMLDGARMWAYVFVGFMFANLIFNFFQFGVFGIAV